MARAPLPHLIVLLALSIGDGDTIRVRQGGRAISVRLACIDAPEMAQSPTASGLGTTCRCVCRSALRSGWM